MGLKRDFTQKKQAPTLPELRKLLRRRFPGRSLVFDDFVARTCKVSNRYRDVSCPPSFSRRSLRPPVKFRSIEYRVELRIRDTARASLTLRVRDLDVVSESLNGLEFHGLGHFPLTASSTEIPRHRKSFWQSF